MFRTMDTEWAADLGLALERHELALLYQPIVDLETLRMVGAEALLRWRHPSRGMLPPSAFIPAAERSGMIVPIGAWALREACRQGASWQALEHGGSTVGIAVNVSGTQLRDPEFVDAARSAMEETAIQPHAVLLELTETVLLDERVVGPTLGRLKGLGVRVAVDDFGTGHSSLEYLARFPLDVLKVDKSYVELLGDRALDRPAALVRGILLLARSLGLRTVAEGVATPAQLRLLRGLGCELGQGSLFEDPVDASSLDERLGQPLGPPV
jgi:EAL domain-containing protein (putative c-di-GMP-specific phosphodiesterase class I)